MKIFIKTQAKEQRPVLYTAKNTVFAEMVGETHYTVNLQSSTVKKTANPRERGRLISRVSNIQMFTFQQKSHKTYKEIQIYGPFKELK